MGWLHQPDNDRGYNPSSQLVVAHLCRACFWWVVLAKKPEAPTLKVMYTVIVAVDMADAVLAQVQSFSAEPSTFQVWSLVEWGETQTKDQYLEPQTIIYK